jgi:hypothetical protein
MSIKVAEHTYKKAIHTAISLGNNWQRAAWCALGAARMARQCRAQRANYVAMLAAHAAIRYSRQMADRGEAGRIDQEARLILRSIAESA